MAREQGFIDPPPYPPDACDGDVGFVDPFDGPLWLVMSPPIPGRPSVEALAAAVERLRIGEDG